MLERRQTDTLPHLCYNVKCPPMSEMTCPPDSSVREILNTIEVQQMTAAPDTVDETQFNITEIDEEIFAECCLAKKCLCKTCYIPDCHGEDEVVVELLPESMNKPGHCCGEYECQRKPNCTAGGDSQQYWLKGCQRCHCFSGKPMCIQICDEAVNKTKAICKPEKLNVFFEHGESWRVGCYECECVDGVEKCVLPFCSNINCPRERQVTLKDGCCPICWPDCAPMPNELISARNGNDKYGSGPRRYDDDITEELDDNNTPHNTDYSAENEIDTLPDIPFGEEDEQQQEETEKQLSGANSTAEAQTTTKAADGNTTTDSSISASISTTTTTTTTTITTSTSTASPAGHTTASLALAEYLPISPSTAAPKAIDALASEPAIVTACPPVAASRHDAPATFQLYPEDVMPEVQVITESCKHWMIYIVIGILVALIAVLIAWIIQLRLKQRSYRPVSHTDDNFNKMSCNIKATNAYV
ncbi:uncharacterized protein LOC129243019 [Anastrepha obliqua]|uniref:uncharacterized protein LOC129243019 n=1 Tax=Anastrepha obliqua TaxID=95512 RepID=UPI00240A5D02|nr:uncharacterized protein LOC129243019 [Anastrepha obliqua]